MRALGVFLTGFLLLILLATALVFGRKASPEHAGAKEQSRPGQIAATDPITPVPERIPILWQLRILVVRSRLREWHKRQL
jgi:hypothetical protein